MRSSIVCGLTVSAVLAGAAVAAEQGLVEPGGKIGAMTVVRGDTDNSELNVFDPCPISAPKPGTYHTSCTVTKVPRLFIGAGQHEQTQKELDDAWKHERWRLWVDERQVDLPRFGTTDKHQHSIIGKLGSWRTWTVTLAGAPSGKHTIHYQVQTPSGPIDFTLAITITK
jgi:hypothetical protein